MKRDSADQDKNRHSIEEVTYPSSPDGGYGWIICLCSFLIFLVTDGFIFSFGIIFIELLDYFHESKSKTAMVGSIFAGAPLLFGPIISTLINKWGIRWVSMAGAILTTASIVASVMAPSVDVLIFTYGLMGGLSIGLMYLPATLIIGFYFEKRRAFATGLATCGSGIGLFVFPPLCVYLINEYGWRGALLIISGIILQCFICSALYRPINTMKLSYSTSELSKKVHNLHENIKMVQQHEDSLGDIEKVNSYLTEYIEPKVFLQDNTELQKNVSVQHANLQTISRNEDNNLSELHEENDVIENAQSPKRQTNVKLVLQNDKAAELSDLQDCKNNTQEIKSKIQDSNINTQNNIEKVCSKDNSPNTEALDIKSHREVHDTTSVDIKRTATCMDKIYKALPGLTLLKSPAFLLCVLMSSLWTAHGTVLTILPNHIILSGLSAKEASLLVSIIGITNIIGRISSGFLADRFDCMFVNGMAMFFGAISNFVFPFTNNYILLSTAAGLFGLGMGGWVTLRPIVLVDIVGLEKLTDAFGVLAFFQGIAMCSGPPFAGFLYYLTKSYELPFLTVALSYLVGAAVCIPMRLLSPKRISDV